MQETLTSFQIGEPYCGVIAPIETNRLVKLWSNEEHPFSQGHAHSEGMAHKTGRRVVHGSITPHHGYSIAGHGSNEDL